MAFLQAQRRLFRMTNPRAEFTVHRVVHDEHGPTQVRLEQSWRGVAVDLAQRIAHFNRNHHVTLVHGCNPPTPAHLSLAPALRAEQAAPRAGGATAGMECCADCSARLVAAATEGAPRLAWAVTERRGLAERWLVTVAVQSGEVPRKTSIVPTALERPEKPPRGG